MLSGLELAETTMIHDVYKAVVSHWGGSSHTSTSPWVSSLRDDDCIMFDFFTYIFSEVPRRRCSCCLFVAHCSRCCLGPDVPAHGGADVMVKRHLAPLMSDSTAIARRAFLNQAVVMIRRQITRPFVCRG